MTIKRKEIYSNYILQNKTFSGNIYAKCTFSGCIFTGVKVENCTFIHCSFHNCRFSGVKARSCIFRFSKFDKGHIIYSDLEQCLFSKVEGSLFIRSNVTTRDCSFSQFYLCQDPAFVPPSVITDTLIAPEGDLIGWKFVRGCIIKLLIPSSARRSNAFGRKCRAEYAKVLSIEGKDGEPLQSVHSELHTPIDYVAGELVFPDGWNPNRFIECTSGIHFFLTREEAIEYGK